MISVVIWDGLQDLVTSIDVTRDELIESGENNVQHA